MKVLICGDREWWNAKKIADRIKQLPVGTVVIHGACRGADRIAGNAAFNHGLVVREYPARWKKYGRSAGPIRNREMLDKENPDLIIAFHESILESKGTKDMLKEATKRGIPTELISGKGSEIKEKEDGR